MPKKKLLKKFFSVLFFFFFIFLLIVGIDYFFYVFRIKKIIIVAPKNSPSINLLRLSKQTTLFLDEKKQSEKLIAANPYLKKIEIKKNLPSTLILYPQFYHPQAKLKIDGGFFVLSENGRILEKAKKNQYGLSLINFYQKLNPQKFTVGEFINYKEITSVLKIIPIFEKLDIKINSIDISGFSMITFNLDNNQVVVSGEKDTEKIKYELTEILKKLKIEHQSFKKLDLRFNKPIIVF